MTKPVCAVVGIGPQNGASFARRFASEGYAVALLSRKTEYSSKLAAEIDSAEVYACDVTDPSAVDVAFATIRAEMGEIDVLVYNAGSGVWGNIEELSAHDFEQSWRINTMGAFLVSKQVIPSMKEKKTAASFSSAPPRLCAAGRLPLHLRRRKHLSAVWPRQWPGISGQAEFTFRSSSSTEASNCWMRKQTSKHPRLWTRMISPGQRTFCHSSHARPGHLR